MILKSASITITLLTFRNCVFSTNTLEASNPLNRDASGEYVIVFCQCKPPTCFNTRSFSFAGVSVVK